MYARACTHTHTHTHVPHCLCSWRPKNWPNLTCIIYAPLPSCFMLVYLSTSCRRTLAREHTHKRRHTHTPPYLSLHAAPTDKDILLPKVPGHCGKFLLIFKVQMKCWLFSGNPLSSPGRCLIHLKNVSIVLHTFMKDLLQCVRIIVDMSLSPTYIQLRNWS